MKLLVLLALLAPAVCYAECTEYKLIEVDNRFEATCIGGGGNALEAKELLVKQLEEDKTITVPVQTTGSVITTVNVSASDIHPEEMGIKTYACNGRGCTYGKPADDSQVLRNIDGTPYRKK